MYGLTLKIDVCILMLQLIAHMTNEIEKISDLRKLSQSEKNHKLSENNCLLKILKKSNKGKITLNVSRLKINTAEDQYPWNHLGE